MVNVIMPQMTQLSFSPVRVKTAPARRPRTTRVVNSGKDRRINIGSTIVRHGGYRVFYPEPAKAFKCHAFERFQREHCALLTANVSISSACPCEMARRDGLTNDNVSFAKKAKRSVLAWSGSRPFFSVAEITAWSKASTATGGAYRMRMIPRWKMAMFNSVSGIAKGVGTGSIATFIKHAVNLPLNAARLRKDAPSHREHSRGERDRFEDRLVEGRRLRAAISLYGKKCHWIY